MRFKQFYLQESSDVTIPKILYHGSNYDFSKFNLSHVGKGEGLQKFGFGVYLTDTETLSNFYATQLKGTQVIYQCRIPSDSRLYEWDSPVDDFLHNKFIKYLTDNDFEEDAEKLQDEYEQYNEYMDFESYYKILSHLVGSPKKSSEVFVKFGIDGCVANDIQKRGTIYVIFDTSLIKIIDKDILNEEIDLTESSKELNIVSFLSDKMSKTLDEIVRKPEQFKQYQPNNSGQFVIPFKKFIGDLNVLKNSFLKSLKYGKLFLDLGSTKDSTHPFLEIISHKDGRNVRKKAGGYYTNEIDLEVHLPFIDKQTSLPYEGYSKHWKSLLVHELTHAIQDLKGKRSHQNRKKKEAEAPKEPEV